MSEKTWLNLLVAAVLPIAVGAFLLIPYDVLGPVALATLALAFASDRGLKAYAGKLETVVTKMDAAAPTNRLHVLETLLSPPEIQLLGISASTDAKTAAAILLRHKEFLLACGAPVRMVGVTAAITLLLLFFDVLGD